MTQYDSLEKLLNSLTKRFESVARHHIDWSPPYDEKDHEEIWHELYLYNGKRGKNKRRSKKIDSKTVIFVEPPLELEEWVQVARKMIRNNLNLDTPLQMEQVLPFFKSLGWINNNSQYGYRLPYLLENRAVGSKSNHQYGLRICRVGTIKLSWENEAQRDDIFNFCYTVHLFSDFLCTNPALGLSSLLCDLPVHKDSVQLVEYDYLDALSIYVASPTISPNVIDQLYKVLRLKSASREYGKASSENRIRWRTPTNRVSTLIKFVEETKQMDWSKRLEMWNKQYPKWPYSNLNSLRAVYYRAKVKRKPKRIKPD